MMTTTEIDIGAVVAVLLSLAGAIAYYLRASGKWREFQTNRAARKDEAEEKARVAEMERTGELQDRFDRLVEDRLSDFDARIDQLQAEKNELKAELTARITALETERKALSSEIDQLKEENREYRHSIATMEEALTRAHNDRATESARWRDTQESLERDLDTLRGRVASLEGELARKTNELDAVRAEQHNYKISLREMELDKVKLESVNESLVKENANLTSLVERVLAAIKPPEPRTIGDAG